MEDSEVVLEVYSSHGELIRTGAGNGDAFINYKLAAGEEDSVPVERRIELYGVRVHGVYQCLAKRAGTAIGSGGDDDDISVRVNPLGRENSGPEKGQTRCDGSNNSKSVAHSKFLYQIKSLFRSFFNSFVKGASSASFPNWGRGCNVKIQAALRG